MIKLNFIGCGKEGEAMNKFLNNRYAKVFTYKGFDICTLKSARPAKGDRLGYVVDDKRFANQDFNLLEDAIKAIDKHFPFR